MGMFYCWGFKIGGLFLRSIIDQVASRYMEVDLSGRKKRNPTSDNISWVFDMFVSCIGSMIVFDNFRYFILQITETNGLGRGRITDDVELDLSLIASVMSTICISGSGIATYIVTRTEFSGTIFHCAVWSGLIITIFGASCDAIPMYPCLRPGASSGWEF